MSLVLVSAAAFAIRGKMLTYRLVAADPDAVPADSTLAAFASRRGAPLYGRYCAGCHRASGRGDPDAGVPNLADNDWLYGEGRVSEIENIIEHGIRAHAPKTRNLAEMPAYAVPPPGAVPLPDAKESPFAAFRPSDIQDLVEYLFALESRPHDESAATRGRELYAGRGGCYDCHSPDGRGDPAIGAPNLTDRIWLYGDGSRQALRDTLERGRRGVCPAWSRKLGADAIRELAVYVYSLSHPDATRKLAGLRTVGG